MLSPSELEQKYSPHVRKVGGLKLLPSAQVFLLLEDCSGCAVRLLGVEAFRLLEGGGVQPAMEFSNVCFGTVTGQGNDVQYTPDLRLRSPWDTDPEALSSTQRLVAEGAQSGYAWFEVSIEDVKTNELLFSRTGT